MVSIMIDHFYVFSYNRGKFLNNCIESIERNYQDSNITVVDDCSDDIETLSYINDLNQKYRVVTPFSKNEKNTKYGNLYKNKNWSINDAKDKSFKQVMLVSEDTQFVRPFTNMFFKDLNLFFNSIGNSFQVFPFFIAKVFSMNETPIQNNLLLLKDSNFFIHNTETEKHQNFIFSDFGIIQVERFFDLFEKFEDDELDSITKCKQRGLKLGLYSYPLCSLLPFNNYYRIKNNNNKLTNLLNKIAKTGFYPYESMTDNQVNSLLKKPNNVIAFAEDWLTCPNVPNSDLWSFWGGFFNLEVYNDERRYLAQELQKVKESKLTNDLKHSIMIQLCEKFLEDLDNGHSYNSNNTSLGYY
jgi:hypothetical protein